jgi:acyl-CoA hydrolase
MSLHFGNHSNKICSPSQAVSNIRPGSLVFVGTACATPQVLVQALESAVNASDDITILSFITDGAVPHENGRPVTKCRHKCFFVGSDLREAIKEGTAEYIPMSLAQLPFLIKNGRFPIDVSLIQVSAPDRNGYVSLGISVDIGMIATRVAKKVIAQVNPNMPFTFGDSLIHLDRIDHLVINDAPLFEYHHPPADDVAQQVAAYIAGVIEDGSTLQIGLGRVPNAALPYLLDCTDLGIHSY